MVCNNGWAVFDLADLGNIRRDLQWFNMIHSSCTILYHNLEDQLDPPDIKYITKDPLWSMYCPISRYGKSAGFIGYHIYLHWSKIQKSLYNDLPGLPILPHIIYRPKSWSTLSAISSRYQLNLQWSVVICKYDLLDRVFKIEKYIGFHQKDMMVDHLDGCTYSDLADHIFRNNIHVHLNTR